MFPTGSQFANGLDDFRNGGQGISGQLSANGQPQTESMHEFPPLSGQERSNSQFGSYGGAMSLGGISHPQSSTARSQLSNTSGAPGLTSSRTPGPQGQSSGLLSQDRDVRALRMYQDSSLTAIQISQAEQQHSTQNSAQNRQQASGGSVTGDLVESPSQSQSSDQPPLSQMTDTDRWGIPGLLRTVRNEGADIASLAVGQDLTTLGLDLNQME